ncbi:hypothetical protein [Allocoleopsis franciscana]|uniref:Uncharacterized protein n=1 Tax=Allocoleopsis franciscana PCC 7113 TaxID=1173027 RepID=K9WAN7_9CYAN|nr:hypothetical protein [Allocoleopsis franciscana]AFZ16834.1 hypothetical protein Mic7113_0936 [Allocoleopsis franciscana PCC 7113]
MNFPTLKVPPIREPRRCVLCAGLRQAEYLVNHKIFRATEEAEVIFSCIHKTRYKFSVIRH